MAIVTVKEKPMRRLAQKIKGGVRDHKRHFIIETNDAASTLAQLEAAQDPTTGLKVPQFFELYPSDLGCFCQGVEFEQKEEAPWVFDGFFTYSSETSMEQEQEKEANPLSQPAKIRYGHDRYTRKVWKDINGKAILNSAKEPFNPPIEIESGRPVITVTKNLSTFSGSMAEAYQDAINSDSFLGYPPYTVRLMGIEADLILAIPQAYWTVTGVFAVNRETWRLNVLDQGYNQLAESMTSANSPGLSPIIDGRDGMPVQTPQRLDGHGLIIPVGTAASVFLPFKVYQELPFSALGLL